MKPESGGSEALEAQLQSSIPSERFFENPYTFYDQIRDISSVFWIQNLGSWVVTDYEVVSKGLRDSRFSVNRKQNYFDNLSPSESAELQPLREFFQLWLMFIDPPYHDKLKSLFAKPFSPRSLQHYSTSVNDVAVELLTRGDSKNVDFLTSFAIPFSVAALAKILGLRAEDYMGVVHLTEQLLSFLGGNKADINKGREALSAYEKLMEYLKQVITEKRSNPGNDIISGGVQLLDDAKISEPELMAIVANLLVDGHEPIAHTLSNGLHSLIQNPSELSRLQSQPDLIDKAVEEMLRINPFFQYSARRATEDLVLSGIRLKPNQRVMFMLGAANRDPKVFSQPNSFQLRDENKHLSFGQGIHYCLGAALGRMTSVIALNQIITLKENLSLTSAKVTWRQSVGYRGLTEFPIHWESK